MAIDHDDNELDNPANQPDHHENPTCSKNLKNPENSENNPNTCTNSKFLPSQDKNSNHSSNSKNDSKGKHSSNKDSKNNKSDSKNSNQKSTECSENSIQYLNRIRDFSKGKVNEWLEKNDPFFNLESQLDLNLELK